MCNLEYEEEKKSAIEMHQDDMWIWGNRLIRYLFIQHFHMLQYQFAFRIGDDLSK